MKIKKTFAFVVAFALVLTIFVAAQACEVASRNTSCTAHYHRSFPIFGTLEPCIEGAHSAESDTDEHVYLVTVVTKQDNTVVASKQAQKSASVATRVTNATGTAKAVCTGYCIIGDGTLEERTPQDGQW